MLSNLVKLKKKRKVIGRGGSRGGTSGKGHKGQKARSGGKIRVQFEGGQTPLTRRLPKRGFNNYEFRKEFSIVSLDFLQKVFDETNTELITKETFVEYGIIRHVRENVKVLSNGIIKSAISLEVDGCSASAISLIESVGGKVKIISRQ